MRNLKSQNATLSSGGCRKLPCTLTRSFFPPQARSGVSGPAAKSILLQTSAGKDIASEGGEDPAGKKSSLHFIYPPQHFIQLRMICF